MSTETPISLCTCGHPFADHSDRAFVPCIGSVPPLPFHHTSCGCPGYTPKP